MDNISMSDAELLKFAIENGMLDAALVQEKIEMQRRKELLEKHPYKIWQGDKEYWYTYLPNGDKRKLVKKKELSALETAIYEYWDQQEIPRFRDRFDAWTERQKKCGRSDNTIEKYESDYKRFFQGDVFESLPISDISDEEIAEFITRLLERKQIPYRALKAMFGYICGVMEKSIRDKLISENPCKYVDLEMFKQYCVLEKPKTADERTISNKEKKILLDKLEGSNRINIARFAVELSLYTGMRVGELAGLKWEDINYEEKIITICRSEKYNRKKKEHYISSTKNDKVRYFPITTEIENLLIKIKKVELQNGYLGECVFCDENGRVHASRISDCARNMTMSSEFKRPKSIHAFRRTLNSTLRCSGVSVTVASALLGHTERVNDSNYTYDVAEMSEKRKVIEFANQFPASNQKSNQK